MGGRYDGLAERFEARAPGRRLRHRPRRPSPRPHGRRLPRTAAARGRGHGGRAGRGSGRGRGGLARGLAVVALAAHVRRRPRGGPRRGRGGGASWPAAAAPSTRSSTAPPASGARASPGWRRRSHRRAEDLRAARGALRRHGGRARRCAGLDVAPLRDAGRRLVDGGGTTYITTRPSGRSRLCRRRGGRPRHPRQGRAARALPGRLRLLDLGFGHCRMVYATSAGGSAPAALEHLEVVRVATKYPITAAAHFGHRAAGRGGEGQRLRRARYPLVGLAHGMSVRLVATGRTLLKTGSPSARSCSPRLRA